MAPCSWFARRRRGAPCPAGSPAPDQLRLLLGGGYYSANKKLFDFAIDF